MERLRKLIENRDKGINFDVATERLISTIQSFSKEETEIVLTTVGIIPELFDKDSTEEKLYSKASDAVLAKALTYLGFETALFKTRGDSADVFAKSKIWGYSLIADAKSFRLSRTAKNQKDFKIKALNDWKNEARADYAILVTPYYQYPTKQSQIYRQALDCNVCLFSWETLFFLLKNDICENSELTLAPLWNYSNLRASECLHKDSKKNFLKLFVAFITETLKIHDFKWKESLEENRSVALACGMREIRDLREEISRIKKLSYQEVVEKLIDAIGYESRISTIRSVLEKIDRMMGKAAND